VNIPKLIFRLMLGRRLPITEGELEVPGINRPVSIRRDEYGVAYIDAAGDEDAWYGLGFCHGQDRAFQLELQLRLTRGALAEMVGPAALPMDRLSRRIGFHHAALQQLEVLDDEIQEMMEAYARGVTAGARAGCRRQAHEFTLLRTAPSPYKAADALATLTLMSFNLASNWDCELVRLKILTEDGPEALTALDPKFPEWLPATSPPTKLTGDTIDRLAEDVAIFASVTGQGGGSNNWIIASSRTATGRPILANDPHLAPAIPSYWYLAHIRTPDWSAAGASFVGSPGFPIGYNGGAAWGITAGVIDNTDLFIEEIGPDGRSVREGNQFVPCKTRQETIQVKGGEPVEEEVMLTSRGPIISPALEGELGAISMRATWLDRRPLRGLFRLHRAQSFAEFRRNFEQWPVFPLNMVYADASGSIGWQLAGEAPQRKKGWGTLPLPGWDPEVGWEDAPIPFDQMPHLADPEIGFIATANTQPTPETEESPFLGVDWIDGYRLARIVEQLEARSDWDLDSTLALQMDQESILWRELRGAVLKAPGDAEETRQALSLLKAWDGVLAEESAAAAVFELFVVEMTRRVIEAKAPRTARWVLGKGFTPLLPRNFFPMRILRHLSRLMRERPEDWFDRPWDAEIADALGAAVATLREKHGSDPKRWGWGQVRSLTLRHTVGEQVPLDRIFNLGPFPWGGDATTIAQAGVDLLKPLGDPSVFASIRVAIDVGRWDENLFLLPGGQSGNPLSPHYDDLLPLWQRGEGISIAWSPAKIEQASQSTLRLVPKSPQAKS